MNARELDKVLELARAGIGQEVRDMINSLYVDDFTMPELIAFDALLRPVYERQQEQTREPAPVVKLKSVRSPAPKSG